MGVVSLGSILRVSYWIIRLVAVARRFLRFVSTGRCRLQAASRMQRPARFTIAISSAGSVLHAPLGILRLLEVHIGAGIVRILEVRDHIVGGSSRDSPNARKIHD